MQLCYDILCPPFQYHPELDVLNAAQSGAMIPNLVTHEWSYMEKQLREVCSDCLSACLVILTDLYFSSTRRLTLRMTGSYSHSLLEQMIFV